MNIKENTITINYPFNVSYSLCEETHMFDIQKNVLRMDRSTKNRRFVLLDSVVDEIYGRIIRSYFDFYCDDVFYKVIRSGERNKSLDVFVDIFTDLDKFDVDRRNEPLISIGGGVVTDLGGFIASTYRRGVPHISIPTTLMGFVDASVGIKTGINFNKHKNRMGSFSPPQNVYLDKSFLKTLPTRHVVNGLGEIFKIALIKDAVLFEKLETFGHLFFESINHIEAEEILHISIIDMLSELEPNLFEENLERCVDFGHTFSPIWEMNDDELLHGEAVAMDCVLCSCISRNRGLLKEVDIERISNLYSALKFPTLGTIDKNSLWESVCERKLHRGGLQRIPLPTQIGKYVFVNDLIEEEIENAIEIAKSIIQ